MGQRSPHTNAIAREERAHKLIAITEMRLAGKTFQEISDATGLSKPQICRLLKAQRKELNERSAENVEYWIEHQIDRYEAVVRLAAKAFEKSQQDKLRIERSRDADGKLVRKIVREGQSGNPAYLARITEALARIDKLRGIEKSDLNITQQTTVVSADKAAIAAVDPLVILRQEPAYFEYLHDRALIEDCQSSPMGEVSEQGPLENGPASATHQPGNHGNAGSNGHAGNGHAGNGHAKPNGFLPPAPRQE